MNAIIMAAGLGSRLRPLTEKIPKPLIKVLGKPMLERNIEYLIEKNIKEIYVVVGYLHEKFEYLKKKYPEVKIIYNNKYKEYNNIYSFYLIRNFLENSFLLDGDIFISKNILDISLSHFTYFSKKVNRNNLEWQLINDNLKVKKICVGGKNNYIISGVSFLKKPDSLKLKKLVEEYILDEKIKKNYFWDDLVKENIKEFDIYIKPLEGDDIFEIDNLEELKEIDKSYLNLGGENEKIS